jgi:hypothetical protein
MRKTIWEKVQEGLAELPPEQREVFEKNEFEGVSFREMSEASGVNINTLLARKRYAVLHLRKKLDYLHDMLDDREKITDPELEEELESSERACTSGERHIEHSDCGVTQRTAPVIPSE